MRTITPEQHLAATISPTFHGDFHSSRAKNPISGTWALPLEPQDKAIKRFMSGLKARARKSGREKGNYRFPVFIPEVTTVASYARAFWTMNNLLITGKESLSNAPQGLFDDSVLEEECRT